MTHRKTLQRQMVLLSVKGSGRFLTAEEVFRQVKRTCKGTGLATIYRNLEALSRQGEIFSFEDQDGIRRFAGFAFHDTSFTCESCRRRIDVPIRKLEEQLSSALSGRTVFFSRLDVRGLCRDCTLKRNKQLAKSV